ncbi:MAG TPA: hypothetical protein VEI06_01500 [Gemmatimonadaceae bacterium]|nr:hypothetical protein [Gemmatimonadaceae bacterium]
MRAARKKTAVDSVKRVASEVSSSAVDAGRVVMEEAKNVGERMVEAATDLVQRVT